MHILLKEAQRFKGTQAQSSAILTTKYAIRICFPILSSIIPHPSSLIHRPSVFCLLSTVSCFLCFFSYFSHLFTLPAVSRRLCFAYFIRGGTKVQRHTDTKQRNTHDEIRNTNLFPHSVFCRYRHIRKPVYQVVDIRIAG